MEHLVGMGLVAGVLIATWVAGVRIITRSKPDGVQPDTAPPYAWLVHGRVVHRAAGTFRIWTSLVHADSAAQACDVAGEFNLEAESRANGVQADSGVYWVCDTHASKVPLQKLQGLIDTVTETRASKTRSSAGGVM